MATARLRRHEKARVFMLLFLCIDAASDRKPHLLEPLVGLA